MFLAVGVRQSPPVSPEQARLEALEKVNAALVAERDELQRKEEQAVSAWKWAEERANRLEGELRAAKREASSAGRQKSRSRGDKTMFDEPPRPVGRSLCQTQNSSVIAVLSEAEAQLRAAPPQSLPR